MRDGKRSAFNVSVVARDAVVGKSGALAGSPAKTVPKNPPDASLKQKEENWLCQRSTRFQVTLLSGEH